MLGFVLVGLVAVAVAVHVIVVWLLLMLSLCMTKFLTINNRNNHGPVDELVRTFAHLEGFVLVQWAYDQNHHLSCDHVFHGMTESVTRLLVVLIPTTFLTGNVVCSTGPCTAVL